MALKRDSFFLAEKKQYRKNINTDNQNMKDTNKDKNTRNIDNKKKRQDNFDENRSGISHEDKEEGGKKPFDKKTYRLKKYSKKYKLEQWEEQRKKKLLHNYHKSLKNDSMSGSYKPKTFDEDTTDANDNVGRFVKHPDLIEKENADNKLQKINKDPFWKAKEHYNKIKQEKQVKQQEIEKSKQERLQKLQEYKKKKQERYKKLSKKTKKGQPIMTGRLELLLDKIQRGSN